MTGHVILSAWGSSGWSKHCQGYVCKSTWECTLRLSIQKWRTDRIEHLLDRQHVGMSSIWYASIAIHPAGQSRQWRCPVRGKKLKRGPVLLPITGLKARDHRLLPPFSLPHFSFFFLSSRTASLPSSFVFISLQIGIASIADQFVLLCFAAVTVLLTNHMQNGCWVERSRLVNHLLTHLRWRIGFQALCDCRNG